MPETVYLVLALIFSITFIGIAGTLAGIFVGKSK